jgi:hypothetical protein
MATEDEQELRLKARDAIRRHLMPCRRPDHTWGGPGSGGTCNICKKVLSAEDMALDLEFASEQTEPGPVTYQVHARCFAAWEFERQQGPTPTELRFGSARATLPDSERDSNDRGHRE